MSKIGIVTIHRINNYGSQLQSYALQTVLENMGHAVELIDYQFPNEYHKSALRQKSSKQKKSIVYKIKTLFLKMIYAYPLYKQQKHIVRFRNEKLQLSEKHYPSQDSIFKEKLDYDILITGSDQVWNPKYTHNDPVFFLKFSNISNKFSYASSIGVSDVDAETLGVFSRYLSDYKYISVRESSSLKLLDKCKISRKVVSLDPTLLLNKFDWSNIMVKQKRNYKYILCYFLNYTFEAHPYVDRLADYLSRVTGLKIIRVARPPYNIVNLNTTFAVGSSTEEFLGLIEGAELVLTTSFHGTAFALNFDIPFYTIIEKRTNKDSRILDLLMSIDCEDRILDLTDKFPDKENIFKKRSQHSYDLLNKKIQESKEYLRQIAECDESRIV